MDVVNEGKQDYYVCRKCHNTFIFKPDEIKWYERGTYSEKTIICKECGCINVIQYKDAYGLNVNNDKRYYI